MPLFCRKAVSEFSANPTAEEVTFGIDAANLTAIVTGGGGGLGGEIARVLSLRGANVIIADKNMAAGKERKEAILKQNPAAKVEVMELDLSSMASVRNFAGKFKSTGLPLNLLINNAGVWVQPYTLSVDKIELHFAINHVGHFLLTNLLLDVMKNTARESNIEGRIVNVSSSVHYCWDLERRLDKINSKSGYNSFSAYRVSKLATLLHAIELSRRLKEEGAVVTANSVHPGIVATHIADHHPLMRIGFSRYLYKLLLKDVHQGAATTCYVALHPRVKGVSGKYFSGCKISKPWPMTTDRCDLARKLWDFTSSLIK